MRLRKEAGVPWLTSEDKLVCFGDSLTASEIGYVSYLQKRLGDKGIEVINSGFPGDKTMWALTRLKQDVIDLKPTAVSIYFGANDFAIGRSIWTDEPTISAQGFKDGLIWIIHLCRILGNIQKFSINIPFAKFEGKAFLEYGFGMDYSRAAREAADQANALIVPLDSIFFEKWLDKRHEANEQGFVFSRDGIHMTPQGYADIADAMIKTWEIDA